MRKRLEVVKSPRGIDAMKAIHEREKVKPDAALRRRNKNQGKTVHQESNGYNAGK